MTKKKKNPLYFLHYFSKGSICIKVITVQISIPAPSSPAQWARFLSALNRLFWSTLLCLTGRQLKAHFGYNESEHMEPVEETLSAHLGLTAGSPSSITVVGRD